MRPADHLFCLFDQVLDNGCGWFERVDQPNRHTSADIDGLRIMACSGGTDVLELLALLVNQVILAMPAVGKSIT